MRKTNKFKRLKNKKEAVYGTAGFLKNIGILQMSESGIFMHAGNLFTVIYEKNLPDATQCINDQQFLRQLDVTYSYLSLASAASDLYLQIVISAESFEKAQERVEVLDTELKEKIRVKRVLLGQRLKMTLSGIADNLTDKNLSEEIAYTLNGSDTWSKYAILDFAEDKRDSFQTSKGFFAFLSVYEYPDKFSNDESKSLYAIFKDVPEILGMKSTFEPITDFAIAQFMKEKYIGYEGVLSKMKRVNPTLYNVVAQPVEVDNRNFLCGESVFLLHAKTQEALNDAVKVFSKKALEENCKVRSVCGEQKRLIRDYFFLELSPKKTTRFLPMSNIAFLLPAQYSSGDIAEEQTINEENMEEMRKLFFS